MGYKIKNGIRYFGNSVVKITQARYNALSDAEKMDGTVYAISDARSFLDMIYPVGSVYISTVSTDPSTYLPGTSWEAFGTGRTLVGIDTTQTEFNTVEKTGGEKTHTLSSGESGVPPHKHSIPQHGHGFTQPAYSVTGGNSSGAITGGSHSHQVDMSNAGGGRTDWGLVQAGAHSGNVLLRYGQSGSRSNTNTATHSHDLPAHTHTVTRTTNGSVSDKAAFDSNYNTESDALKSHNNLQPYITVYMWRRIS